MLQFERLRMQNFLSFREADVNLNQQGLILIHGENCDSTTSLDSNGAGKSAFFEGITWALFGKTARGVEADEVVNIHVGKDCFIKLCLGDGDTKYRIERYRQHSEGKNDLFFWKNDQSLQAATNTETQKTLEKELRVDFSSFIASVLMSQGSMKGLAAHTSDKEQKEILEKILGFTSFLPQLQRTRRKLDVLRTSIRENTLKKDEAERSIQEKTEETVQIKDRLETFEQRREARLQELAGEEATLKSDLVGFAQDIKNYDVKIEKLELEKKKLESMQGLLNDLEKEIVVQTYAISGLRGAETGLFTSILQKKKKIEDGENLLDTDCPVCLRPLRQEDLGNLRLRIGKEIEKVELQVESTKKKIESEKRSLEDLKEQEGLLRVAVEKKEEIVAPLFMWIRNRAVSASSIAHTNVRLKQISKDMAASSDQKSDFEGMLVKTKKRMREHMTELVGFEAKIVKDEECIPYYQFWDEAFGKNLRSYILDSVIPSLADKVNEGLEVLTGGRLRVKLDTQTTLKGGGVREKFSIKILNSDGGTSYRASSGGERRRVDIAMMFGLQHLAQMRSKACFSCLFFDEIFDVLDSSGCERVMDLLRNYAREKMTIWVVSHNDDLRQFFDSVVTVTKKDRISSIN